MALVAKASRTVFLKNLVILAMCAGFLVWFAYDGFIGYLKINDDLIAKFKDSASLDAEAHELFNSWTGWGNETPARRKEADEVRVRHARSIDMATWKGSFDIDVQRWIVWGLALVSVGALWWVIHCQRRRAIADERTVSPANGVVIPWENILKVDNTRWKSIGIVDITYKDASGAEKKAEFDDYKLEREQLLPILDQLGEKAVNAEFIPKDEVAG